MCVVCVLVGLRVGVRVVERVFVCDYVSECMCVLV